MYDLPFALEKVNAAKADSELARLRAERPDVIPVLLGDEDIFSAEWAEFVDTFDDPKRILIEASTLDIDDWFAVRKSQLYVPEDRTLTGSWRFHLAYRTAMFPIDLFYLPFRLLSRLSGWPKHRLLTPSPFVKFDTTGEDEAHGLDALKAQVAEMEESGLTSPEEVAMIRKGLAEMESAQGVYPDPVHYVTPHTGTEVAAGLLRGGAPWECAAWLQHGVYAIVASKPVLVAHCRWLWEQHGARIITASTDHIGFEVDRALTHSDEAKEVLERFLLLGATEVNADYRGTNGSSLIGAERWWVWWD